MSYFQGIRSTRVYQHDYFDADEELMKPEENLEINEEQLKKWRQNLERAEEDNRQQDNNQEQEILYDGMIFLRRLSRLCLQFGIIGLVVGFFFWGYSTTVKDYSWNANEIVDNIVIYTGNCLLNISDSQDYLQYKVYGKGNLEQQIKPQKEFQIKGEIVDRGMANLYIQNPYHDVRSCMVDLMLPRNLSNLNIICSIDSECIIVFAQQELQIQENFNATCEKNAKMQMNIRNIQTNNFTFISDSAGTLFVNHILTKEGYISMANGELVIQSTKSFQLVYTSQSHAVCTRGFQLIDQVSEDCYISSLQNATIIEKICKGKISICEKNSCDIQQKIQVIGNLATIYANILYDIGKPLIIDKDQVEVFSTQVFKQQIDFDEDSLIKIQQFMNNSGSADVAVRIDVVGSYLLQHSYTTYWSFFSNPSYANFQPWWLSAFSAGFLNPTFSHLTVSIKPGICPWNPVLTSKQKIQIRNLIKQSFNTTYGEAIYIDVDDSLRTDEKLKENENYFGLTYLQQKQKGKFENWLILDDEANTVVYEYLKYDENFIAAITLSLVSSLIFSVVCIYFLKEILKGLEVYVLNSCSQFQHYSTTTTGYAPNNTIKIVNDIMAKLKQQPDKREPPLVMSIFSYIFYLFAQNQFKSSPTLFIQTLFRLSNQEETDLYYANELDDIYLSVDQEEIKEKYEQFCYLNKMTIESLSQYEYCFNFFGFEFAEKQNVLVLSKIKFNSKAKSYQQLSLEEKLNMNSIEIFFQTQCLLTGISADTLNSDVLYQNYVKFCGNHIKVEPFNIQELSNNYNFQITDKKIVQLTKIPFFVGDQVFATSQGFLRKIVQSLINKNLQSTSSQQPVFILRRQEQKKLTEKEQISNNNKSESMQFHLNPFKQIEKDNLARIYNKLSLIWLSIIYNLDGSGCTFDYERKSILVKYFESIYMDGWKKTDLIIVLGNAVIGGITILPLLYFIIIINTSYSPYSIYNPETLLFIEDIFFRPWIIFDYFRHFDDWAYAFFIVLICYFILTVLVQTQQYYCTQFPDEISYMMEQERLKKGSALFTLLQWWIFIFLAFCVFFYFGLIIVWLLLGSIINPNFYLVYSSSALSLVAFITAQLNQIKETYEMTCEEINKIIKNIQSTTFSQLIRPIIKELQRVSDTSISIIASKSMREAKQFAQNMGFGDKLEELCNMTNQMVENSEPLDLAQDQLKLQKMKETFIQTSSEIFLEKMKEQFKIPESLAKLLLKSYFASSEEIVQGLQKEIESKTKIPYPILKWFYQTLTQFFNLQSQVNNKSGRNSLQQFLEQINQQLIELFIQIVISKEEMKEKDLNIMHVLQQLLINQSEINILSQFTKIQEILQKPDKYFNIYKKILEVFMKLHNLEKQKCSNLEQIKKDYLFQIYTLCNIDQKIKFLYQFLFNNQKYLIIPEEILNQNQCQSCSEFLCKIIQEFQEPVDPLSESNLYQQYQFKFIVNYVRNDFPSLPVSQQNINILDKNNSKSVLEIGITYISLCTKDWKKELQINLEGYDLELFYDILYIGSNFLWSSKYFDGNNSQKKSIYQIDKREERLTNRNLIKFISQALDFSENAVIGLILILKNEINNQSPYLEQAYIEISQKSNQIPQSNSKQIEDQVKITKFVIELLSKTNFEDIFPYLLENKDLPLCKKLIKEFIKMVIQKGDIAIFKLFNGCFIQNTILLWIKKSKEKKISYSKGGLVHYYEQENFKEYYDNQDIQDYEKYSLEFGYLFQKQDGKQQEVKQEFIQREDLNIYNSPKLTFYNFLQYINSIDKNNTFIDVIKKEVNLSMFLFEILKKQDCILRQQDLESEVPKSVFAKGIQNLSYILQFLDIDQMQKSINFFIKQNQSSENNFQIDKILQHITKVSQIEKTVYIATYKLQQIIPYQFNRLTNLFIDQIFQTTQGLDISFYKDILRIFKFELSEFNNINGQISINKRSIFKINNDQEGFLKNFIPFVEPIINLLSSQNKNIRDQAIEKSLQNFELNISEQYLSQFKQIIIDIVDKNYNVLFQLPKDYASQVFKIASQKSLVDEALLLVEGFIKTESIFSRKNENKSSTIFTIVGDYLKYFLTSDLNVFIELVQIHCKKIVRKEKQNQKAIFALFSLMSSQYDYEQLSSIFYLNRQELKLTNFLANCMFSNKKSIFLEEIEIQQILQKKCQIQDFKIVIDIVNILDYTSVDPEILIEKLRLQSLDSQFFKMVFAFKMQIRNGESLEHFQDQYNQLLQQRKIIYEERETKSDIDILEIINYFSHPRPLHFIFLLDKIKIFGQYEPTSLLISGILGIVKYDKFNRYKEKSFDCIFHRQNQIEQYSQISIEKSLFYIAQTSNQDLQEAFQFLQLATGLDQILINAIFQEKWNNNPFVDYIQKIFEKSITFKIIDLFKNLSSLNEEDMLTIIEYETLKNANYIEDSLYKGRKILAKSLNIKRVQPKLNRNWNNIKMYNQNEQMVDEEDSGIDILEQIQKSLSSIAKGKISKHFPLSTIILINVLKQLRQIKQGKSIKNYLQQESIKIKELISIAIIIYERYLYFYNNEQFYNFNFEGTIKLLYIGIFGTVELQDQNSEYKLTNLISYPSLRVSFTDRTDFNPVLCFQLGRHQYFKVFCQFSLNQKKTILQQFWKDLLENTEQKFESYIQYPQNTDLIGQDLQQQKPDLYNLITKLENYSGNEHAFIKEEDWKISIKLMAKMGTDIELTQQLMYYYAGDFTYSIEEKLQQEEISLISFKQLVINLIKQVEGSVEKLNFLINLIYNPKDLDKDNRYQIWEEGKDSIFIDIITIQVRLRLEQFRCIGEFKDQAKLIPNYYLYKSKGDDYQIKKKDEDEQEQENPNQILNIYFNNLFSNMNIQLLKLLFQDDDEYIIENNNNKLSSALGILIDSCQEIQEALKFPLKILFRCFLGDIEAWYTLINSILNLELKPFSRHFIIVLLSSLKKQGQRNTNITQEQIKSTSFQELLRQHTKCNLFTLIETPLMELIKINQAKQYKIITNLEMDEINIQNDFCRNIFKYYDCIVQQNFQNLIDSIWFEELFYKMIKQQQGIDSSIQNEISYILNFLLSSLVKKPQDIEYEKYIQAFQQEKNKGAWIFIKGMIFTDFSKDINVAIDHSYQFFETLQMKEFYHYSQLLTSISLYKYLDMIPKKPEILLYPFFTLDKINDQNNDQDQKKQLEKFKAIQSDIKYYKNLPKDSQGIQQCLIELIFENKQFICNLVGLDKMLFFNQSIFGHPDQSLLQIIQKRLIQQVFNQNDLNYDLQMKFFQAIIDLEKDKSKKNINNFKLQKDQTQPQEIKDQTQLEEIQQLTQKLFLKKEIIYTDQDKQNKLILAELEKFYKQNNIESLKIILKQIIKYDSKEEQDRILGKQHPISKLLDIAQKLKNQIILLQNQIDEFSEEKLLSLIELIMQNIFQEGKEQKLQQLKSCTKTIISIKNKRFSEISTEFYSIFQIDEFNRKNITNFMQDFIISMQTPTKLINEKLNSMAHLDSSSHYRNLSNVSKKIEETTDLSYDDLFKILDKQGRRVVKPEDILQFLKRLNIDITHHKLREILVQIKGEVLDMETCLIDFYEFKEIMQQLTTQSLLLSLTYLGISKQQLFLALLITVIYLGLVLTFILIGVKALAIPGTFAAIVNAILPMIGGFGLNKQATNKQIKAVNLNTIMEIVKKAIKIISEKVI